MVNWINPEAHQHRGLTSGFYRWKVKTYENRFYDVNFVWKLDHITISNLVTCLVTCAAYRAYSNYNLITIWSVYPNLCSTECGATSTVSRLPQSLSYTPGRPHTSTRVSSAGGNPCVDTLSSFTQPYG